MKTFIRMWFSGKASPPSRITEKMKAIGFESQAGENDYYYDWESLPELGDILKLADKVHEALKGENVYFKLVSEMDV